MIFRRRSIMKNKLAILVPALLAILACSKEMPAPAIDPDGGEKPEGQSTASLVIKALTDSRSKVIHGGSLTRVPASTGKRETN